MTCDDTSQTAAQVVTSSALSLYSLTFLRWYISYDSPLKRCLKDTFLLLLLTCVFPCFPFALGRFGFDVFAVRVLLWFKATSTSFEAAMFNFDTKDFHRLVFRVQTTRKSWQVERNLRWNFEQAQISRKLAQATTSHHKLAVKRGTRMHKLKTCDGLRSRLISTINNLKV